MQDCVDRFLEEAEFSKRLSAEIVANLPAAAAGGDVSLVQSALCATSAQTFASYISTATTEMAGALAARAAEISQRHSATKTAHELNGKFAMESGMIEGAFGTVDDFLKVRHLWCMHW